MPVIRVQPYADGLAALNVGRDIKLGDIVRPAFDIGIANAAPANGVAPIRGKFIKSDVHGGLLRGNLSDVYSSITATVVFPRPEQEWVEYDLGVHEKWIGLLWTGGVNIVAVMFRSWGDTASDGLTLNVTTWTRHTGSTLKLWAGGQPDSSALVVVFTLTK